MKAQTNMDWPWFGHRASSKSSGVQLGPDSQSPPPWICAHEGLVAHSGFSLLILFFHTPKHLCPSILLHFPDRELSTLGGKNHFIHFWMVSHSFVCWHTVGRVGGPFSGPPPYSPQGDICVQHHLTAQMRIPMLFVNGSLFIFPVNSVDRREKHFLLILIVNYGFL